MEMETIYVDSLGCCHRTGDATMTAVETGFFVGKCDTWVEGFYYNASEDHIRIYPFKPYDQLAAAQTQYEADLAELQAAYQEGVNSV